MLPFVLNTKWPLRKIWLLRYLVNNFINFQKIEINGIFAKITKVFLFISKQPNIPQRPFVFKTNGRISSADHIQTLAVAFL